MYAASRRSHKFCVYFTIQWLVSLGFTFIFSALFSKLWRINKVFAAASSMKRVTITERDVLKPFVVLVTLNFVILLSWTLVDPMVFERVYTDELTSYARCVPQGDQWKGFISVLAILNFFALIVVNVQAYQARSINDELSESKYIGLATLSMLQVRFDHHVVLSSFFPICYSSCSLYHQIFIVGVPLLVIVYNDPSAYFFVWCGIIFIVCTTILLLIFVPKVVRFLSKASNRSASKFSSKWSNVSQNSNPPTAVGGKSFSHAASTVSEVGDKADKKATTMTSANNKRVSFVDDESELAKDKLEELKGLIMTEHNIDITPILLKIDGAEEAVLVTADAPTEETKAEGEGEGKDDVA